MLLLSEWNRQVDAASCPWLILGKGPTFAKHRELDLRPYRTISLNHVVREVAVDVAHFIDLDALEACADAVRTNSRWLMVPRHMHVNFIPSHEPVETFFDKVPILREMNESGRLVVYHHDQSPWHPATPAPPEGERLLRVRSFSVEGAVAALASCGVRVVRTLGVDGSTSYADVFSDLNNTVRLANGQTSFDIQFLHIHQIASENAMDYGPLEEPIRVYVGTDDSQMVAVRVLEYSIKKYASRPVEIIPMLNLPVPIPQDPRNRPRTGFSFARLLIPKLAGYRGRGIYLDADMLVFGDIAEIWDLPMNGCRVHCSRQDQPPEQWKNNPHFQPGRQMSVMLLDCAQLNWDIEQIVRDLDSGKYNYEKLMFDLCIVPHDEIGEGIPQEWNSLEHFVPGRTRLLHYTDMGQQPWKYSHNPNRSIWRAFYHEAVQAGAIDPALVEAGIAAGHLMPELRYELSLAKEMRINERSPDGVGSERQRALQLECMALRAEVDIVRREFATCDQARWEGEKEIRYLREEHSKLQAHLAAMQDEMAALQSSISWRVGRAATKPVRVARNLLRRSG